MTASITTKQHRSHLEILSCIRLDDKGSRCLGLLESQVDRQLLCVKCNSSYSAIDEIPVLKENAGSTLDEFYSQVYENISRLEVMHEDNPRMQQAQTLWDLLPEFVTANNIEGYSLEIGCGPGIFADRVPNYIGLDYALNCLLAREFEAYNRVCASGDLLPFQSQTLSLIFSLNTLEHVPELDRSIYEIDRVLKPGGYLVLRPAWNCTQYNCDGVDYFDYKELTLKNKLIKLLLPVLKSKFYKAATRIPKRLCRETILSKIQTVFWQRLNPRFDLMYKVSDSEAYASIDTHECIYWFLQRGYECISHPTLIKRVVAGHDVVLLRKND
jgi:SAM-dependent methyltransferase